MKFFPLCVVLAGCSLLMPSTAAWSSGSTPGIPSDPVACPGSRDISEAISVDHFLFFPSESSATAASEALDIGALRYQVRTAETEPGWVLYVAHNNVPTPMELGAAKAFLEDLSAQHGGRYGWFSCGIA